MRWRFSDSAICDVLNGKGNRTLKETFDEVCLVLQIFFAVCEARARLGLFDVALEDEVNVDALDQSPNLSEVGSERAKHLVFLRIDWSRAKNPLHSCDSHAFQGVPKQQGVFRPLELIEVEVAAKAIDIIGVDAVVVVAESNLWDQLLNSTLETSGEIEEREEVLSPPFGPGWPVLVNERIKVVFIFRADGHLSPSRLPIGSDARSSATYEVSHQCTVADASARA